MRRIIRRVLRTDLVKISSLNAGANLLKLITAVIINKVAAAFLGPAGLALLGQFYNFSAIAVSFASLGIGAGITKYTAEYRDDADKRAFLLGTAVRIGALATGATALIIFFGRFYFAVAVFQSPSFAPFFSFFAASLVFLTGNSFLLSLLAGHKEFNKIITINIVSSLLGLGIMVLMTAGYLLPGALIGIILSHMVNFAITLRAVVRSGWWWWRDCWRRFDAAIVRDLLKFSSMIFTHVLATAYVQLLIRGHIMETLSLTAAGYWQGIMRLSDSYVMFGVGTLTLYYLPRLSELQTVRELRREVAKVFLFVMPLAIFSSGALYAGREFVIAWLFAESFAPMKELFFSQFLGNVFRVAAWLLAYVLLAKAKTAVYIVGELSCGICFYLLTVFLIKRYGLVGATHAYAVTYAGYAILLAVLCVVIFRGRDVAPRQSVPDYMAGEPL